MTEPTPQPWGEVARWMRESTPVNKGTLDGVGRRLPQLANPVLIGALGVGALGAGIAMRAMRPSRRRGRSSRFRTLVLATADDAIRSRVAEFDPSTPIDVSADVGEGFGKPALASFDIVLPRGLEVAPDALVDLLDVATRAVWDNRELAPLAIRGRVLAEDPSSSCDSAMDQGGAPESDSMEERSAGRSMSRAGARAVDGDAPDGAAVDPAQDSGETSAIVLADMTALGFVDETARPSDLFARYGAPASDPNWHP